MDSPRIPLELIGKICEHLLAQGYHATVAAFLPCSRDIYALVAPLLYRRVTLTRANVKGFFSGLATPPERLRRGRRRVRSAPSDISWGRFKSRDFYLEWASIYESAPDESLRSRREYLIWPNADADSGDEESDVESPNGAQLLPSRPAKKKRSGIQLAWPHPTRNSHARKLALLEHIQSLDISELPSVELSATLRRVRFEGRPRRVSIGPKAFWQLVDWKDRHGGHNHPFFDIIESLQISDLCIQYPVVDQALEIAYMSTRIVTNEEHLSRGSSVDQYTYLRFRLPDLLRGEFCAMARALCELVRSPFGKSVTVHNLAGSADCIDFGDSHLKCKWWMRPCSCQDIYLSNPVLDTACYNHYQPENRVHYAVLDCSWFVDALAEDAESSSSPSSSSSSPREVEWEFIDFDWETGQSQPMERSARWPNMIDDFWAELKRGMGELHDIREVKQTVGFKNSMDAEPCVCCGSGQLSYDQSTIG